MGYWITLRRGSERQGFSAATAIEALAKIADREREGWGEVRIIDPNGIETNARYLRCAVDSEAEMV